MTASTQFWLVVLISTSVFVGVFQAIVSFWRDQQIRELEHRMKELVTDLNGRPCAFTDERGFRRDRC